MQTIYAFSYNPSIATGTNTTKTVWRMAYQQPILLYKGTANSIKLVIYNNAQKVVDLTDYDVQVQIVDKDTQEHFVTRTATVDTPSNGVATVTFTEADLRNLQHRFYHIIARLMPPNDGSTQVAGEILYLDDNYGAFTPVTIEDAWNFDPTNISTTDGNASITFTSIGETPNSFSGFGGNYLRVNTAEDSLEFVEAVTPVLTSVDNIIPSTNNTYYLGNVDHQWHSLYSGNVKVGNITISGSNISTAPSAVNSLILTANRHTITFSDNSVGNQGIGAVMQFDDTSGSPGPRFETWYGNVATPSDPPGQHSLDIYAADANSYVEFASHDSNTFMGVDAVGAFIYTNWLVNKNHSWYFGADGNFRLPNDGKISNNNGNAAVLFNANNITVVTNDADGSTIHTSSFNESGGLTLDGDLTPVGDAVHSLGTPSNQWKDLYVSNSTIYLGGVPVSVDAGGNLLVNGNTVSGGGAANTGNITFSVATLSTSGTNQDMTLDPNGSGNVKVQGRLQVTGNLDLLNTNFTGTYPYWSFVQPDTSTLKLKTNISNADVNTDVLSIDRETQSFTAHGNVTAPRFISNIATGTAPFTVTSTTQVANLNAATAGSADSATTAGTVTTASQPNITSVGTLSTLTVSGFTSLGPIGNVQITGGSNGQYLRTNGAGVLSWATVTGGGAANTGNIIFVDNSITSTNTNENIVLDPNGTGYVNVNNALQIIAANGQVQGGLYTSGDADYLNIAADTGRGLKFFVNLENGGITVHPNGVLATTGQVTTLNPDTDFTIRAVNSTGPVNHDYIFGSDGIINLPYGGDIVSQDAGGVDLVAGPGVNGYVGLVDSNYHNWVWVDNSGSYIWAGDGFTNKSWTFNSAGDILFPDGTTQSTAFNLDNIDVSGNTISSINTNGDIILDPNGTGGVTITSAANNWVFTNSGYLTLPGNGYQQLESSGGYVGLFADSSGDNDAIEITQDTSITAKIGVGGQINLVVNSGDASQKTWSFGNNGGLTLPGILILAGDSGQRLESSAGNVAIVTDANTGSNNGIAIDQNNSLTAKIGLGGHIDLVVNSGDASQKTWAFGLDGNASFPGDLTVAGNITIQGGTTVVNTADLTVEDSIINLHSQANLAPWTQDDGRDIGIAFHYYKGADKHAYLVWQNDTSHLEYYSEGTETSGVISGTLGTIHANIFSANVATGTAPFIVKSTTQVANLNAATAGTAGTVTTAAQPNITSLGTLTALDVNAQANATIFKSNIATGTAPFIVTSTTQVANLNVAAAGTATTAGTVTTAAQPNITSVGTLTGLTVSGTIDATSSANVALGAVGNVHITGGTNGYVLSTDGSGNLSWVAQSGGGGGSTGNITFTTATISTSGTNENMTLDPNGTGNVSVVGGMTVTANITSPIFTSNIATGTAPFVVTSTTQVANLNVAQAGQLINGNSNVSITANSNVSIYVTGNATARAVFTSTGANIAGTANITGAVSMLSTLSVTSNANVGNIGAATAVITTAANVPLIQNSTSNIAIASGANVTISSAGTANVLTVTSTGANIAGTANITGAVAMGSTLAVTGNITTSGSYGNISGANVVTANTMVTTSTTFASLPAAATAGAGARGFITDANTTTFASQVSGGGANALPVFSNGTNWYVG